MTAMMDYTNLASLEQTLDTQLREAAIMLAAQDQRIAALRETISDLECRLNAANRRHPANRMTERGAGDSVSAARRSRESRLRRVFLREM